MRAPSKLANVLLDLGRDEVEHIVADDGMFMFGLRAQDCDASFEFRRLDVRSEA